MPRSKTDLKPRILAEARRVLLEEGVSGLTTRRVAKGVGCTAAALYLYFENKDELLLALAEEGFDLLNTALGAAQARDREAALPALCRAYVDFALQHPQVYEVMFQLPAHLMARVPRERYRKQRGVLDVLGAAALEGDPTQELALRTATLIWSSLHGAISLHLAHRIDKSVRGPELLEDAIRVALAAARVTPTLPAS